MGSAFPLCATAAIFRLRLCECALGVFLLCIGSCQKSLVVLEECIVTIYSINFLGFFLRMEKNVSIAVASLFFPNRTSISQKCFLDTFWHHFPKVWCDSSASTWFEGVHFDNEDLYALWAKTLPEICFNACILSYGCCAYFLTILFVKSIGFVHLFITYIMK